MTVQSPTPPRAGTGPSQGDGPLGAPAPDQSLLLEALAPWHLALLGDPAFVPLQPLLQRAVLLQWPERLVEVMRGRRGLIPQVLVARQGQGAAGLIVSRQINRSGSCWQVQHLRLAVPSGRRELAKLLLGEAIQRAQGATSWIATSSTADLDRLAALREQGFQPLRTERLWRWQSEPAAPAVATDGRQASGEPLLRVLNRRTALALLQLEQVACPAQLRQLLDRCSDDLLDQSRGRGWLLVDGARNQAVAAVRWLAEHPGGGHDLELTVHPGWSHLIGAGTERLLLQAQQALGDGEPLWLRTDVHDSALEQWLLRRGAEPRGERVLMARSVWRRQDLHAPAREAARRIEAVLEQLQPQRRPLPTPLRPR